MTFPELANSLTRAATRARAATQRLSPAHVGFAVIAALTACATTGSGRTRVVAVEPLSASQTLFLSSFGPDAGASLIREKVRGSLIEGPRWRVSEDSASADVVLTGSATNVAGQVDGSTDYGGTAVLRLFSNKTRQAVWLFEYRRGVCGLRCSVSTRVSRQIAKALNGISSGAR